jgi:4-amino-4-deoxy-L-arabinose transferase-like glycosyltransferase
MSRSGSAVLNPTPTEAAGYSGVAVVWLALLAVAFSVCFYSAWNAFHSMLWVLAGTGGLFMAWAAGIVLIPRLFPGGRHLMANARIPWRTIAIVALLGCIVRIAYFAAVPKWPIVSDEADYLKLAQGLLNTGEYVATTEVPTVTLRAERPPGYSFFLVPLLAVSARFGVFAGQLLLFVGTLLVLFSLAREVVGEQAALIAAVMISFWPTLVFSTGSAITEPLALFLTTASIWSFWRTLERPRWWAWAIVTGVAVGFAALVKPPMLTFPAVWIIYIVLSQRQRLALTERCAIALVFMGLVVAPWTIRNYFVLRSFVPISTNGGSVFYRANNPLATGGFTAKGERDLDALISDEVNWNRTGFQWGLEWIRQHPVGFGELVLHKQRRFLASDDDGACYTYSCFVLPQRSMSRYFTNPQPEKMKELTADAALYISNGWWFILWILTATSLIRHRGYWFTFDRGALLMLPFLHLLLIHSVFESQSRHHIPAVGLICIVAAAALVGSINSSGFSRMRHGLASTRSYRQV